MANIFSSRFVGGSTFPDWEFVSSAPPPIAGLNTVVGRGIAGGDAFTCSQGFLEKLLSTFGATYKDINFRAQVQIYYVATFPPGFPIYLCQFGEPVGPTTSMSLTGGFYSQSNSTFIQYYADGSIEIEVQLGTGSPNYTNVSAAGALAMDGSVNAVQIAVHFASNTSMTYHILVNDVDVLTDTVTTASGGAWTYKSGQPQNSGYTWFTIYGTSQSYGASKSIQTSFSEVLIDDTSAIVTYSQNATIPPLATALCPVGMGAVTVTKSVSGIADPTVPSFDFATVGLTPTTFSLSDGDSQTFTGVAQGAGYSVQEVSSPIFTTSYTVSTGDPASSFTVTAGQTVTIAVANVAIQAEPAIRWLRRTPHAVNELKRVFYRRLDLLLDTGVGGDSDPVLYMRYSNDGGQTYNTAKSASYGASGQTSQRVYWAPLGSGRDRVFEVYGDDPAPIRIVDAYIDVTPGAS